MIASDEPHSPGCSLFSACMLSRYFPRPSISQSFFWRLNSPWNQPNKPLVSSAPELRSLMFQIDVQCAIFISWVDSWQKPMRFFSHAFCCHHVRADGPHSRGRSLFPRANHLSLFRGSAYQSALFDGPDISRILCGRESKSLECSSFVWCSKVRCRRFAAVLLASGASKPFCCDHFLNFTESI